jgi:hypothetical protein
VLRARAESGSSPRDADAAVGCLREALTLLDPAYPSSVAAAADLALALQTRYEMTGGSRISTRLSGMAGR